MEKDRSMSIGSAALSSAIGTPSSTSWTPGHADSPRTLTEYYAAVDLAVMLVDAAKGLEAQR